MFPSTTTNIPHQIGPTSQPCVFVGYAPDSKGYLCFHPPTERIITSRHVIFDETTFPFYTQNPSNSPSFTSQTPSHPYLLQPISAQPQNFQVSPIHIPHPPTPPNISLPQTVHSSSNTTNQPPTEPPHQPSPSHPMQTRSKSGLSKPKHIFTLLHHPTTPTTPTSFSQAHKLPEWRAAMSQEFHAL